MRPSCEAAPQIQARLVDMSGVRRSEPKLATVLKRLLLYGVITLLSFIFCLPLLWAISTSLKSVPQVFTIPPEWIPRPVVWRNYPDALTHIPFLRYVTNTLTVALPSVLGAVVSNSITAYGFARIGWPYRNVFFAVCLATMMIPYQVTMIPLFVMFTRVGWQDTYYPLIAPHLVGSAYYIFLLRQFFLMIPAELSDAARVDGCSEAGILFRIIMPLSVPALATVGVFQFMASWNDYLGPLIYLKTQDLYTVSLGLTRYRGSDMTIGRWAWLMAASVTTLIPILVLFFFAQRSFIEGISLTGLKG